MASSDSTASHRFDRAAALIEGLTSTLRGVPYFFIAMIGGFMVGAGYQPRDLPEAAFISLFAIFVGLSFLIVFPALAACMYLLIFSELPRLPLLSTVFLLNAWSAYINGHGDIFKSVWMTVGTLAIYFTLIHPFIRAYRRQRHRD